MPVRASTPASATQLAAILLLAVALLSAVAAAPAQAVQRSDVAVELDDERDTVAGTGRVVLPAGVGELTRRGAAGCEGCAWRVTSPCLDAGSGLGVAFDGQSACRSVTRGCPEGTTRRVWWLPASGPWQDLGLHCLADRPVTVEEVGGSVRERIQQSLPRLAPAHLPDRGVVTGLPTVFASGQPAGPQSYDWRLLGQEVRVTIRPSWTWHFPDGTSQVADEPGELLPAGPVRHTFVRSGPAVVRCQTRWSAQFELRGIGTFPVPGSVVQDEAVVVQVGQGRALLRPRG